LQILKNLKIVEKIPGVKRMTLQSLILSARPQVVTYTIDECAYTRKTERIFYVREYGRVYMP